MQEPLLNEAAVTGNVGLATLCLDKGLNVHPVDPRNGDAPLQTAANMGHNALVELFLSRGAYVDHKNTFLGLALEKAAANGHIDVVKTLLKYGASVNKPALCGWTPLAAAAVANKPEIVPLLLNAGASLSRVNRENKTPWEIAIDWDHSEVIKAILVWAKQKDSQKFSSLYVDHSRLGRIALNNDIRGVILHYCSQTTQQFFESRNSANLTPLAYAESKGKIALGLLGRKFYRMGMMDRMKGRCQPFFVFYPIPPPYLVKIFLNPIGKLLGRNAEFPYPWVVPVQEISFSTPFPRIGELWAKSPIYDKIRDMIRASINHKPL